MVGGVPYLLDVSHEGYAGFVGLWIVCCPVDFVCDAHAFEVLLQWVVGVGVSGGLAVGEEQFWG